MASIDEGNFSHEIGYGHDLGRVWQQTTEINTNNEASIRYFNGLYEFHTNTAGNEKELHYISSPTGIISIFTSTNQGDNTLNYILKDHLGSLTHVLSEDGSVVEEQNFDAWGRRRNPANWTYTDVPETYTFNRGYTMHEHLDAFKLINMNGRMYDPILSRFLSVDPIIQLPDYTQSYNRYSYVFNNPLRFTDPSGFVVDWFMNGTGDVYYNSSYKKGDENKIEGEGWTWVGENGVFNKADNFVLLQNRDLLSTYNIETEYDRSIIRNDAKVVSFNVEASFKGQKALAFMKRQGAETASSGGGDSDNWGANAKTAARMFWEWDQGVGPANRTFTNDRVANAMRNAWKVGEAREFFYNKYAGVTDLTGASVTNYSGKFGLQGLVRAGFDPIEQYVGSYSIDIHVIPRNMLQYTLTNVTSMKSFTYGIAPEWERSSFRLNGNTQQTYIFTEPIR